jgi:hypothetical protein
MTYGRSANTCLVGRKIVPFVAGPTEQNRSDRQRTGDPAQEKGTYSAYGAFRPLLFGPPSPQPYPKPASKTSRPRDQLRLRSLETSHPPRQDAQINSLNILSTFMKQRTYLTTLPDRSPHQRNSKKTKRNLFSATPLRSRGLSSLTSLSSHISTGNTTRQPR